jgi:hypothetical protein
MNEKEIIKKYVDNFTRVSPILLVRQMKVTHTRAEYFCLRIWRGQWDEARKLRYNGK